MKRLLFLAPIALVCILAAVSLAAPLGKATADFDNSQPQRSETAFGRLVADALLDASGADIALVNAGALKSGTLKAGEIREAQLQALLAFPEDQVAVISISGAQLRAALERAVQAYPTGSTAFLHGAGFNASFNTQATMNSRLIMLRINGREVQNTDSIRVAMPLPLAQGGNGYFTIWADGAIEQANRSIIQSLTRWIEKKGTLSPDRIARFVPQ